MNRIYRLIWSKALKCIVAVSETTKGRGKDNTKSQAVGGAPTISQEVSALKQARAPPYLHKLISLRNAIPAIAMSAGLMGMYSGVSNAGTTTISSGNFVNTISAANTNFYVRSTVNSFTNYGQINSSTNTIIGVQNVGTLGTLSNTTGTFSGTVSTGTISSKNTAFLNNAG